MYKILVATAAAALMAGSAHAQMAPEPQTGNLDESTQNQIELQEPTDDLSIPSIDFGTTQSITEDDMDEGDLRTKGNYSANVKNSEDLKGR